MAFEHESFPDTHDRFAAMPDFAGLVFRGRTYTQSAESNELQSIIRARTARIGGMVARDGDRINGAAVVVDAEAGTITLTEGWIYAAGDVRRVPERVIEGVDLTGDVSIGIRIRRSYVTADDMPELRGLIPGSAGEGEDGAARVIEAVSWSLRSLAEPGDYYQVYLVRGGTVLDQTPPANLTAIAQQIAAKDRGVTGGNYVIEGCQVTAIGQVGAAMHFAVSEGAASIYGFTRSRSAALRYGEPLSWDTEQIDTEPHVFSDGGTGTAVIPLNRGPIDQVLAASITKQVTVTIVRGSPNNTADILPKNSVTEVLSVTQGATSFAAGTSWNLVANALDWSPGGPEPAVGSSYQATIRFLEVVTPEAIGVQSVTLAGGVTGTPVFVTYRWKLPRVDRLCLDENGAIVYLRGVSSAVRPKPPIERANLLGLADIYNDWRAAPVVTNNGTRACHLPELWRYLNFFKDVADLVALLRLRADIDSREPVAKHDVFVDPCVDDTYRDQGVPQTAAVYGGSIQLAVDPTIHQIQMAAPVLLPYVEEVAIEQPLKTGCVKINPWANFNPLPAQLSISPAVDYWTETRTIWLSDKTRQISGTNDRTTVTEELVDRRQESLAYLRQIEVSYTIKGFGPGEELQLLAFDNIDITPEPLLIGDANGEVHGSFVVPADVTAGSKLLFAGGASGAEAWAEFVGGGTVDITTMQRLVSIETVRPPLDATPAPEPDSPTADPNLPQNVIRDWRWSTGRSTGPVKSDPQAQSFMPPEPRHFTGVELHICKVGDPGNPISVGIVPMRDGDPTEEVRASAVVPMTTVAVGDRIKPTFPAPLLLTSDAMWAFVVKSDDAEHSISVANLGDFDTETQTFVTRNPYPIAMRHESSNAASWDHKQGSDITFRLYAARFTATERRVLLGTVHLAQCSDLVIKATVQLPSRDCSLHFEVVRPGAGGTIVMLPNDPVELTDYITEEVEVWAVLRGTELVSPVLFPGVTVIAGKLRATGDYVCRAFAGKAGAIARYKALLPAGAGATFTIDRADGDWEALPLAETEMLNDGWIERRHEKAALMADQVRVRIQLTGTPAARPAVSDPRFITF
ncbi:Uncharacterised protein [Starkeya nomas]|uniref:DUF4815 domain-containing protein n=1 Tax=Starkeya nomas TaxID=2666134 RepID=A0A5S9PCC6_9HYPH|nr:DUF4815 domain-containing protein [Starkeya nomas]CAA0101347.1 Uncharacterised protein [Starkeya nomas]